jgi:hypothetical protein
MLGWLPKITIPGQDMEKGQDCPGVDKKCQGSKHFSQ